MVSKRKVPSEKGGPPRTVYAVERAMSIHVDIGPDLFRCEERKLPAGGPMRLSSSLPTASIPVAESLSGRKKIAVAEGLAHMRTLASVLEDLDAQRDALISLHQHVRQRVSAAVEADFESYEERSIIQTMVEATGDRLDLTALVQQELAGHPDVGDVITALRSRLEKQLHAAQARSLPLRSTPSCAGTSDRSPSDALQLSASSARTETSEDCSANRLLTSSRRPLPTR